MSAALYVVKRDGRAEDVSFDKIKSRLAKLCYGLDRKRVDVDRLCIKVIDQLKPGITTRELDSLAAESSAMLSSRHPDYGTLAARIEVSNLHKQTGKRFSEVMRSLYEHRHPETGEHIPMLSDEFIAAVDANKDELDSAIVHDRDFSFSYFGIRTLLNGYLLQTNGFTRERPQHMLMRVSVAIHGSDVAAAIETYEAMSKRYFIHASPTLFNSGKVRGGLISCFLCSLTSHDDSVDGILRSVHECAAIFKAGGGIGLNVHDIRAKGSRIAGTDQRAGGLVPWLKLYNDTAKCVSQGARDSSLAVYLEPWHADIGDFLDLKRNTGKDELRARDLFYALWIPDLFMQRVREDGKWSLFCPKEAPGLSAVHGPDFEDLYCYYEDSGKFRRQVNARDLWLNIIDSQVETGGPYLLYKDTINAENPMAHLGTLRGSNLCAEIVQYSDEAETAACNLCSIGLPSFVRPDGTFDHMDLNRIVRIATVNLDKVIDASDYPSEKSRRSNMRHRPIGIGVNGFADALVKMGIPFDSARAREVCRDVFETIYYSACDASADRAAQVGSFSSFEGSSWSKGQFQFDLVKAHTGKKTTPSGRWDWEGLRVKVKNGMRNSLLTAAMPTATTSQILGFNECFEPYSSNMYTRNVKSGEFQVVTRALLDALCSRGLWDENMRTKLVAHDGEIRDITEIPADLKALYKTGFEMSQRVLIDLAAERAGYLDQTQSLNLFVAEPTSAKISSMHMYAYERGLKTGVYYLRTKATAAALKYSVSAPASCESKAACTSCEA